MRPTRNLLPILALLSVSLSAQTPSQTAPTPSKSQPSGVHKLSPKPWEQYAVYWTAEPGWKTEIHLRNNLPSQSLTVTPALRTADGTESKLPAVTISPNDVGSVDLGTVITSAAPHLAGQYGSVVLRYTAPVSRALYAAVIVQLPGTPIEFHLDAFPKARKPMTGGREGIWWLPRDSAKDWLVLANTSDSSFVAKLTVYESNGKNIRKSISLGPRQTTRLSMGSLVQRGGLAGSFGGISIEAGPRAADVDSAHFVYDETTGLLALMKMFDRNTNATLSERSLTNSPWTIRAPMLPLTNPDPALALPEGTTLKPAIFVRNASGKGYTAHVTFHWRSGTTTGKSTTAVPLQPYMTTTVDVAALQANGTIPASAQWAYVSITAPIKPDDLLAVATSFDAAGRLGAQTPFSDQAANHWEGGMWEVDANHDTIIAVGNADTTASKAQITLYYNSGQGKYQVEPTLAHDEQVWLDIGRLVRDQVPDVHGTTIPLTVMSGSYELESVTDKPTEGLFEGKLVVDKTYGYAVHGCAFCCPHEYDERWVVQSPLNLSVGGSNPQSVWGIDACTNNTVQIPSSGWNTENPQVATASGNVITGAGAGSTSDYAYVTNHTTDSKDYCRYFSVATFGTVNVEQLQITSIDPTIAMIGSNSVQITINGTGFGSSPTVNLPPGFTQTGIGAADTRIVVTVNISLSATVGNNSITVSAGGKTSNAAIFTVNGPNKMVVQTNGDVIGASTVIPGGQARYVTYQVLNVDGTAAANIPIAEDIANHSGYNCTSHPDPGYTYAQCNAQYHTSASGTLRDEWDMYTGYTPSGCGVNITDHWQWCGPPGSNPPAPNPGKTFGTLSGWIHTADSQINGYKNPPYAMPGGFVILP